MRKIRWRALQLLPQLQMQLASQLPELQTRSGRNRQILPLLSARIGNRDSGRRASTKNKLTVRVLSVALDGEGHGVAAAEAERGDAAFQVAALQFVEKRDQ